MIELDIVINVVCDYFNITEQQLLSRSRKAPMPDARHTYVAVVKRLELPFTLSQIMGRINRKYCTYYNSIQKAEWWLSRDVELIYMQIRSYFDGTYEVVRTGQIKSKNYEFKDVLYDGA